MTVWMSPSVYDPKAHYCVTDYIGNICGHEVSLSISTRVFSTWELLYFKQFNQMIKCVQGESKYYKTVLARVRASTHAEISVLLVSLAR